MQTTTVDTFAGMPVWAVWVIAILGVWSLIWKGFALYKAARLQQKAWFVVMFIVNTIGILEIFYIFYFSKLTKTPRPAKR